MTWFVNETAYPDCKDLPPATPCNMTVYRKWNNKPVRCETTQVSYKPSQSRSIRLNVMCKLDIYRIFSAILVLNCTYRTGRKRFIIYEVFDVMQMDTLCCTGNINISDILNTIYYKVIFIHSLLSDVVHGLHMAYTCACWFHMTFFFCFSAAGVYTP